MIDIDNIEENVINYWTLRTPSFSQVRQNEIHNDIGTGWRFALRSCLPINRYRRILDVGTGMGFFCILLSQDKYNMTGIDITPSMIEEAQKEAKIYKSRAKFVRMDAHNLDFDDGTFDAVISRNLTWTLKDVEGAYREWFRVIRPGGRLINYDANYAKALKAGDVDRTLSGDKVAYGHMGVTDDMKSLNDSITLSLEIGNKDRPSWDVEVLKSIGFRKCFVDMDEATDILGLKSDPAAPMFKIIADK